MRDCRVLRVFTRGEAGGNYLGVVTDTSGLNAAAMQEIAADLGYSETIFLDWEAAVPAVRIFTPAVEIPFAGHPLVGAAWVLGSGGSRRCLTCGIGEVPFRVKEDRAWIEVAASREVEAAAGNSASGMGLPAAGRAWMVRLPLRYLLLEIPSVSGVEAARPAFSELAGQSWEGTLLFARRGSRVKARFFAPRLGVPEDPATGSAAVALASALAFAGEEEGRLEIEQGDEVSAPSAISVDWGGGMVLLGGTVRAEEVRKLAR